MRMPHVSAVRALDIFVTACMYVRFGIFTSLGPAMLRSALCCAVGWSFALLVDYRQRMAFSRAIRDGSLKCGKRD